MSLFRELVNTKIRELEELKQNVVLDIETKLRREVESVLEKFSSQINDVESRVMLERERLLFDAVVESRRRVAEVYENLLSDLLNVVYGEIEKMRNSERYAKFLTSLIQDALGYVQSRDVVIYTSPKDRGIVEVIARDLGISALVAERDIKGGVIVASRDGSVSVNYSLEAIINNEIDKIKNIVYSATYER